MKNELSQTKNTSGEEGDSTEERAEDEENTPLNIDEEAARRLKHNKYTVPQDRGWAWVILAGCVFRIFIFGGLMQSYGVFFLQFQKRFNSSASETATMNVIQNIVISVSALMVMTIGLKTFSCRTIIMTGGLNIVTSYLITAFTTNIYVFYIAQGVLGGFGLACISGPVFAILGIYFSKHKGLANSIFTAGGSAGGLVFGPIVIRLFEEYGFTGTMMIVAALMANIIVSGALMRPPEFYTRHAPVNSNSDNDATVNGDREFPNSSPISNNGVRTSGTHLHVTVDEGNHRIDNSKQLNAFRKDRFVLSRMISHDPGLSKDIGSQSPVLERIRANSVGTRRRRTISEDTESLTKQKGSLGKISNLMASISRSKVAMYASESTVCGSFVDINNQVPTSMPVVAPPEEESEDKEALCQRIRSGVISTLRTIFDLNLLRDVSFLYFLLLAFCGVSSVGLIPIFIPTYAYEIGISNERIGLLVSIIAAIDFFAKIGMGVVADRKWIKRNHILALALFIVGTACHFVRFIKTFETMVIFVIISGLCCGQYISSFAVIMSDLIGPERFKQSLGFCTLTHGISIAIFFPLAGYIKDHTKSYVNALHLTGGLAFVASFCALTIPMVQKWASKKHTEKDSEKD